MRMVAMSNLKNKVLTAIGYHKILIWFLTIIPVGIPLCAIIGLMYGIKNKDTIFTKCSAVALFVGIACIVYTLLVIKST